LDAIAKGAAIVAPVGVSVLLDLTHEVLVLEAGGANPLSLDRF
jgi:hypothetical protein